MIFFSVVKDIPLYNIKYVLMYCMYIHSTPNAGWLFYANQHIKDITPELIQCGVDDSVLKSMVSYAKGSERTSFKWTLTDVPRIRFYWLLHTYLQKQGLTHEDMGKVYRTIDVHLLNSTSSNRIACRKVSRIIQNDCNHDNLVQYSEYKKKSSIPSAQNTDSHYSKRNVL